MLCAISGEAPQEPVVSTKSGFVYEKRLITKYLQDHTTEPNHTHDLTLADLIPLKAATTVRPRPPTLTSIPALLATFQNEWDALALETHNLSQQLDKTREELAAALYQVDAAVRVIARLTKERDEAREALGALTVSGGAGSDDKMAVDSNGELPEELKSKVEETQTSLSKTRKKRPVPEDWAAPDTVAMYKVKTTTDVSVQSPTTVAIAGEYAAVAGLTGDASIYSISADKVERQLVVGASITASVWHGLKLIFATVKGTIKIYDGGAEVAELREHAGAVTSLAIHPSGDLLVSVGADRSVVVYDLANNKAVSRTSANSPLNVAAFHPDGHLLAVGAQSGDIIFYQTVNLEEAAFFPLGAPCSAISFSENGFWFAASATGSSIVTIFDIRKQDAAARVKELETGNTVAGISWDYSAQYLAAVGPAGTCILQYVKGEKKWNELLQVAVPGVAVQWGEKASELVVVGREGTVSVLTA